MFARIFFVSAVLLFISVAHGLDCRKFSFAPACRGIMLKRAQNDLTPTQESTVLMNFIIKEAESMGFYDCVPMHFIKNLYSDFKLASKKQ